MTKTLLKDIQFAVFGLGNSLYSDHYNSVSKNVDRWFSELGAKRFAPLGLGDENVVQSLNGSLEADFDHWTEGILHLLAPDHEEGKSKGGGCAKGGECCSKKKKKTGKKVTIVDPNYESSSEAEDAVPDLEDLAGSFSKKTVKNDVEEEEDEEVSTNNGELREMLTPLLRESLTKQGYKLIGTHSGVKLCRWTKVI